MSDLIHLPAIWHLNIKNNFPLLKNRLIFLLTALTLSGFGLLIWLSDMKYVSNFNDVLYQKTEEILDYGVVLDCGSSGTRVFVYRWHRAQSSDTNQLLDIKPLLDHYGHPVQLKVEPGLSSFAGRAKNVRDHLEPLMNLAAANIPTEKHSETVLYILATAGMRMISETDQAEILTAVRSEVPKMVDFVFSDSHADIITGKEEGIYAWISANFVLNKLKVDKYRRQLPTTGVIDMGGGSLQIAFATDGNTEGVDPSNLAKFNLGSHGKELEYSLFVTTHLGFGANVALSKHINSIKEKSPSNSAQDPCFPAGFVSNIDDLDILGVGDWGACTDLLRPLLNKTGCSPDSNTCSLDASFQPSLAGTKDFFGFSEFYYTSEDTLKIAGIWDYERFRSKASEYCATDWSELQTNWKNKMYKADENRLKNQCFKSAWVSLVLHEGLNFPKTGKKLTSLQTINGTEIQWALGALIYRTRFLPLREQSIGETSEVYEANGPSVSPMDTSLVLLIFCIVFVILLLFVHVKRIIHSNRFRSTIYVRLPTGRRREEDII